MQIAGQQGSPPAYVDDSVGCKRVDADGEPRAIPGIEALSQ
jgi:hypothetical protein